MTQRERMNADLIYNPKDWDLVEEQLSYMEKNYDYNLTRPSEEDKRQFDLERRLCAVDAVKCVGCRTCLSTGCPALSFDKAAKKAVIDPIQCVGCTVCAQACPVKAIALCETENR